MENEGVFEIERLLNGSILAAAQRRIYNQKPNPKDRNQTMKSFEIQKTDFQPTFTSLKSKPIFSDFLSESISALFRKVITLFLSFLTGTHLPKSEIYSTNYGPKTGIGSDRRSSP